MMRTTAERSGNARSRSVAPASAQRVEAGAGARAGRGEAELLAFEGLANRSVQAKSTAYYANLLNGAAPQKAHSAEAPVQRTTVTFDCDGTDDYDTEIVRQAQLFHAQGGTGAFYNGETGHDDGTDATADTHFDVFAHGNQGQVGNFTSPQALRATLADIAQELGMPSVGSVTLHSCESAAVHPGTGRKFGDRLHESYRDQLQYVDVAGYDGETVTDHNGVTRVLKDGRTIRDYLIAARDAEDADELDDQFLEPAGEKKETFGDDTLDLYSPSGEELGLWDPDEARAERIRRTREHLDFVRSETEDRPPLGDEDYAKR